MVVGLYKSVPVFSFGHRILPHLQFSLRYQLFGE